MFDLVRGSPEVEAVWSGPVAKGLSLFEDALEVLESMLGTLEPAALDGANAAVGVSYFSTLENIAAAGKALCAARVAETAHWRSKGDRTPAHWVARTTGCSMAEALAATQVPERLRRLPQTDRQFRDGELTLTQARHITEAAMADPDAESGLLEMARNESLTVLREQCQRVIAAACTDDEARYQKVHRDRYVRQWTDSAGAFRMDISGTPDAGAEVLAALEPIAKRLGREARRNGCKVREEALRFDALVELCRPKDAEGKPQRPRYTINIRADRSAWLRGYTVGGEICEIDGIGPVPVSVAQKLLEDGVVNEIGLEGDDVVSLVSHSRYIPADVRRSVIARDPVCVFPGCYRRNDLQFHHWTEDFSKSRRTSLRDVCRVCPFHHDLITRGVMVLIGGPGKWDVRLSPNRHRSGADPPVLSSA